MIRPVGIIVLLETAQLRGAGNRKAGPPLLEGKFGGRPAQRFPEYSAEVGKSASPKWVISS